jgi:hypothetical protein
VFLGEHREMVRKLLGSKILVHSHLLGGWMGQKRGFLAHRRVAS